MIRNTVQHRENVRNSLVSNYKSAAVNQLSYAGGGGSGGGVGISFLCAISNR